MKFNIVTIFPEMFAAVEDFGITHQAIKKGVLQLCCWNPRDFTTDKHRSVDDRPYGGGPGMLMKPEPLTKCLDEVKAVSVGPVVYLSPQGKPLNQSLIQGFSELTDITLLAGRYEGVDERVLNSRVDIEISLGDYVLAGGELAAMVMIEAITRLVPGALGNDLSAAQDSFFGHLLDCPHYTRPEVFETQRVPSVLLSGDHEKIRRWRLEQSIARTKERRPDLLIGAELDKEQVNLLNSLKEGVNLEHEND